MNTMDTPVNTNVLPSERQNTGSSNARVKLRSPAQSNDGSPADTSEKANPMASTNGIATSATM
jgi:hypothetical protein